MNRFVNADFGLAITVFWLFVSDFELGSPTRENAVIVVEFYGSSLRLWSWLQVLVRDFKQSQCR
jgi:hypothetical protein